MAFQFHGFHISSEIFLCFNSAICSNSYSMDFVISQNCPSPKSFHSVFLLSGHCLLALVIQILPPKLFLDLIRTFSPLAHLNYPYLSSLSCLHFPHYSTLNLGSIFSIRLLPIFSTSCPPCPFVMFIGQNNSVFYVFTPG